MSPFGLVAIGRNEGDRLRTCLASAQDQAAVLVYVDSGSSDGSVALAQAHGALVVNLDMSQPFTAARARNEGFRRLLDAAPALTLVQFVDGDCEVAPGWFDTARAFLATHPEVAAVCGRRRERHPERSVYNRLCDLEWNTPVGEARAFGGDVMMRVAALQQVKGYRADLIAGEEPELAVRLRAAGWTLHRLDAEMTLHDAAMTRFGQWWQRAKRAGFAFAEGALLHGAPPERHWVRESRSAWVWGVALPAGVLLAAGVGGPVFLCALAVYPLQVARLALRGEGAPSLRLARAFFLVLGKFAEASGQIKFLAHRLFGSRARLIEYK